MKSCNEKKISAINGERKAAAEEKKNCNENKFQQPNGERKEMKSCDEKISAVVSSPPLIQHCQLLKDTYLYWRELLLKANALFYFSSYFGINFVEVESKWIFPGWEMFEFLKDFPSSL